MKSRIHGSTPRRLILQARLAAASRMLLEMPLPGTAHLENVARRHSTSRKKAAAHLMAMLFHRATLGGRRFLRESIFW